MIAESKYYSKIIKKHFNKELVMTKALKINKESLHSAEQITNEFNSIFRNLGFFLAKNIQQVSKTFTEYQKSFNYAISDSDLTTEELETSFKSLKRNKVKFWILMIESKIIYF